MKVRLSFLLVPLAVVVCIPLVVLIFGSLTGAQEWATILKGGSLRPLFPPEWPTLAPLVEILLDTPEFFHMFWNSCCITIPTVLGQVLVGGPAAWALARIRFVGRRALKILYIALMLLPFQVTMVSSYLVLDHFSLINTRWSIILPGIFSPFAVFIMLQGFSSISESILEAARIDGAGPFRVLVLIGIPLGAPGILSAVVLGILEQWSILEQPMTFLRDSSLWPLSLFHSQLSANTAGPGFVAALLIATPPLLIFLFGQHDLERGIASAGLKE